MTYFPDVLLDSDYVAQTEYKSNFVKILKIEDQVEKKFLKAFVQLGDNENFRFWINVLSDNDYTVEWSNTDVTIAVQSFFKIN